MSATGRRYAFNAAQQMILLRENRPPKVNVARRLMPHSRHASVRSPEWVHVTSASCCFVCARACRISQVAAAADAVRMAVGGHG